MSKNNTLLEVKFSLFIQQQPLSWHMTMSQCEDTLKNWLHFYNNNVIVVCFNVKSWICFKMFSAQNRQTLVPVTVSCQQFD